MTGPTQTAQRTSSPAFRERFPVLQHRVHLSSCSLGARSTALDGALGRLLDVLSRGASAWREFETETDRARQAFGRLIGAQPEQIALVPNASTGAYQVASTLRLDSRCVVVAPVQEFPSIAHVWLAQRPRGARVRFVDLRGRLAPEDVLPTYTAAVDEATALVSVPLVTYVDGGLLPVADVARTAHARGAQVFVDAYQAAGVLPVDVADLQCDYLVAGSCKYLLGLPGVAFLYVRAGASLDLEPALTGWFGRVDPFSFDPRRLDFPPTARRFETGTPPVPALYAANAGLDLIASVDSRAVRAHVAGLLELAEKDLGARGERFRRPCVRGAHLALCQPAPEHLAAWLDRHGISVSARGDVVRLSFHYYNDETDVEALVQALAEFRALPARSRPAGAS